MVLPFNSMPVFQVWNETELGVMWTVVSLRIGQKVSSGIMNNAELSSAVRAVRRFR